MKRSIIVVPIVMVLVIVCMVVVCVTRPDIKVAADSEILCGDAHVYYNDIKGRLCRVDEKGGRAKVIAKDAKLLSAYQDKVLVDTEDGMKVLTYDGDLFAAIYDEHYAPARMDGDYIYYANEDGKLWRMATDGGEKEPVLDILVQKFIIYGKNVIYTSDGNSLMVCSMETGTLGTILDNYEVTTFSADDGYLFLPNPNNGNTLVKMPDDRSRFEELMTIHTTNFVYKNGRLHYIDNVDSDKKEYKLVHDPIMVHGK